MSAQTGPIYSLDGITPRIARGVFIAPNAAVIGNVEIGAGASIWFSAAVRGDDMPVVIGEESNIQDGAIIHATEGVASVFIGRKVVIGHAAVLHGCTVEDGAMIGIGAIILDGAFVGKGAVVAAGALVPPNKQVPAGMLWLGNPGSVRRPVNDGEREFLNYAPAHYRARARGYLDNSIGEGTSA